MNDEILSDINDIVIADRKDGHPALSDGGRERLSPYLEDILVSRLRRREHVMLLEEKLKDRFHERAPVSGEALEAVLVGGPAALDDEALAEILLNPAALAAVAMGIIEDLPQSYHEAMVRNGRREVTEVEVAESNGVGMPPRHSRASSKLPILSAVPGDLDQSFRPIGPACVRRDRYTRRSKPGVLTVALVIADSVFGILRRCLSFLARRRRH